MAYFNWNESLATGIPVIDEQHKKLVGFVNQLSEAMTAGKGKDFIGKLLDELVAYTQYHFALEERNFAKYNFPFSASHTKAHHDLINQVTQFVERHKKSEVAMSIEILSFLTNWVKDHIMKEDMKYVQHFAGKLIN